MFAYPLLPALPPSLRPAALTLPIRSLMSIPKNIDYDSIPAKPNTSNGNPTSASHSGALADLPADVCPICHLRSTTTPVPLAAGVSLPPVNQRSGEGDEENRVFVPAQTDCWGGCRWCYYCIMGELAALDERQRSGGKGKGLEIEEEKVQWNCLRCGGTVTEAWRVGPEPGSNEVIEALAEETPNGHIDTPS